MKNIFVFFLLGFIFTSTIEYFALKSQVTAEFCNKFQAEPLWVSLFNVGIANACIDADFNKSVVLSHEVAGKN
jgi:hypothetical protein